MSVNYRIQSCDGVHCRCFFFELFVLHRHLHVALIHIYLAGIKRKILVQTVLRIVLFASFYLKRKINHITRFVELSHKNSARGIPLMLVVNLQVHLYCTLSIFIASGKMMQRIMVLIVQPWCLS